MRDINDRTALLSVRRRDGTRLSDSEYDEGEDGGNGDEENSGSPPGSLELKRGSSSGKRDIFSAQGRAGIMQMLYRNVFAIVVVVGSILALGGLLFPLYVEFLKRPVCCPLIRPDD